jgi:hypothetical protein
MIADRQCSTHITIYSHAANLMDSKSNNFRIFIFCVIICRQTIIRDHAIYVRTICRYINIFNRPEKERQTLFST